MNDNERARLKRCLAEEIDGCRAEIARLEETQAPVQVDTAVGRLSRMDTIVNQGVSSRALGNARRRLLQLQRALERADEADFGECEECGEPIPIRRLLLIPEAERCVDCADR